MHEVGYYSFFAKMLNNIQYTNLYNITNVMKIIGFEFKKGEYQGHIYDNTYLFLATTIESDGSGYSVDKVKCKTSIIDQFLKDNNLTYDNLLGTDIICYFDKFRNLSMIGKK